MVSRAVSAMMLLLVGVTASSAADGDAVKGRDLARPNCAHCHGVDGNARTTSFQPVPMLAGQPAAYLLQEMQNYASGTRKDTSKGGAMTRILKQLSEQDFADLAEFYATQKRY